MRLNMQCAWSEWIQSTQIQIQHQKSTSCSRMCHAVRSHAYGLSLKAAARPTGQQPFNHDQTLQQDQ